MRKTRKPHIKDDMLFDTDSSVSANIPIQVGSRNWFAWLGSNDGFIYEGSIGHFTARRELRRGIGYWYAYRRFEGKLLKVYLGKTEELTSEHLVKASLQLSGQIPLQRLVINNGSVDQNSRLDIQSPVLPGSMKTLMEVNVPPLTKITPPSLPLKLIPRPHLIQRISTPVTILYAPHGFGTTTVLNEWQQNCGLPVAWVSLDANDNDPLQFWSTVVTALQSAIPGLGKAWLSQIRTSSPFALSTIVVNLADDIVRATNTSQSSPAISLVLDNYHFIQNTEIHTSLQTLVDHMPPALKLVIAGHTRPPLALGYLRAKGLVTEITTDDLRFTLEEGIEYLLQNTPEPFLAYNQMQSLIGRTEGWITGLVLAIPVLVQEYDRSKFKDIYTGAYPLLQDFFKENVIHQQSQDDQTFLRKTSVLKYLTGSLCDAVTGRTDSVEVLNRLWEKNLFVERLEKPGWYRYNNLFSEVLSAELQKQSPDIKLDLHRKAADWYCDQNAYIEAIYHLLGSKSWEQAAVFIEKAAFDELKFFGDDSRLLGWLIALPEEVLLKHEKLLALYTRLAGISSPPEQVNEFLERVENQITSNPHQGQENQRERIFSDIQNIQRMLSMNDPAPLDNLPDDENETHWMMLNGILDYYRYYRRDVVCAETKANKVYEKAQEKNSLYGILMAGGSCASLALSQGYLRRTEQIAHQVLRQAYSICGNFPGPASISLIALSRVCFFRNQLDQAHQLLIRASSVNPDPTSSIEPISIAILRAKIQSARGDNEAAFATIQSARELYYERPPNVWLIQDLISYLRLFRLRQGIFDFSKETPIDQLDIENSPFSALVQVEIHLAQKRNVAAEEILINLINKYPHGFYMLPITQARVLLAITLFEQRKLKEALKVLIEASRHAAPEYCIRPFLDYGSRLESLLSWVLHSENVNTGIQSFLKGILTMLGKANGVQRILPSKQAEELSLAASISPREQEILKLLSRGFSNREIASQCCISPSTVKTHIENIYTKLGVNSRLQAIAQAQMLNIL